MLLAANVVAGGAVVARLSANGGAAALTDDLSVQNWGTKREARESLTHGPLACLPVVDGLPAPAKRLLCARANAPTAPAPAAPAAAVARRPRPGC